VLEGKSCIDVRVGLHYIHDLDQGQDLAGKRHAQIIVYLKRHAQIIVYLISPQTKTCYVLFDKIFGEGCIRINEPETS